MYRVCFADDTLTEVVRGGFASRGAAWRFLVEDFGRCMDAYTEVGHERAELDEATGAAYLADGERVLFTVYLEPDDDAPAPSPAP